MPTDAEFCSRCGAELPSHTRSVSADEVLNVYRTKFECEDCGMRGEVFRTGLAGDGE